MHLPDHIQELTYKYLNLIALNAAAGTQSLKLSEAASACIKFNLRLPQLRLRLWLIIIVAPTTATRCSNNKKRPNCHGYAESFDNLSSCSLMKLTSRQLASYKTAPGAST